MKKTSEVLLKAFAFIVILAGTITMKGQTGTEATWSASGHGYTNGYQPSIITIDSNYVEGMFSANTGPNAPAFYLTNGFDAIRLYANNTFTINPINGTTLSRIEYTFTKTSKAYASVIPPIYGNYATGGTPTSNVPVTDIWTCPINQPSDKPIVITLGSSGQRALLQVTVTYNGNAGQTHTLTYRQNWPNGTLGTGQMEPEFYGNGSTVTVASCNFYCSNYIFDKWNTAADGSGTDYYPGNTFQIYSSIDLYAQWIDLNDGLLDILNPDNVVAGMENGIGYCLWSVTCQTGLAPNIFETTYKGKSFRSNDYIQINSTPSIASGIVTTFSHGIAKKVEVIWDETTTTSRTLNVYGKNIAYADPADLYNANQGTLIGSIVKESGSQNGTLIIKDDNINLGDYAFIGLRSNEGAMYMDEIRITWTAETQPVILFTPSYIDLGNLIVDNQISTTFIVNQANLEYDISLTTNKGSLEPAIIARNADPTEVTWTYTPDRTDIGAFTAIVTAASGHSGENGSCSNILPIDAIVLDNTGTTLTAAKNAYLQNGTTAALINLAGDGTPGSQVQVVGQYGNHLYLQDGESGILVYGSGAPDFATGYSFTSGILTGTFTTYQNSIVELSDFTFQGVEYVTGNSLTPTTASLSALLNDTIHQYEYRYIQLADSVYINATDPLNWELGINEHTTMAMKDLFGTNFNAKTAPEPTDEFMVTGLFNRFFSGGEARCELVPTTLNDIRTSTKATAPVFEPIGGLTVNQAVPTTVITITPAENTTLNYFIDGGDIIQSNNEVVINIHTVTSIHSFASRDFYANSTALTYYYDLPEQTNSVHFSINGIIEDDYTVLVSGELLKVQCPTVEAIGQYILRGWSTSPSSTEVVTMPLTDINSNITLYAVYALPSSYTYTKLTEAEHIEPGEYVILSDDGRGHFYTMKNAFSYFSPSAHLINDLGFAIQNNTLTGDDFSEVTWNISGNDPTAFTITSTADPDLYLYTINNSTGVRIGNTPDTWSMAEDSYINSFFNLKSNAYNRYLTLYVNDNNNVIDWRCYTSSNMYNNNSHPRLTLFKRTPIYVDTDPSYTRIFVNETASNEITISGPSVIPSAAHLNASEGAYLNMGNYPIISSEANWFLIEDGASFIPAESNPTAIKATIQKAITGYGSDDSVLNGWYLLASPVGMVNANGIQILDGSRVDGLTDDDASTFDLYTFDQSQTGGEWRNFEAHGNTMVFGQWTGILYASQIDRTVTFIGALNTSCADQALAYDEGTHFAGWNLIGNPFSHEAFINSNYVSDYYKLVETENEGVMISELQLVQASEEAIHPTEGIFVKATDVDQTFSFSYNGQQKNIVESLINIKVTNSNGSVVDQARVRFNNGFSLDKFMLNNSNTNLYIPQDGKQYAVVRIEEGSETPLNFKAAKNGTYTLSFEVINTEMEYLHLIDNITAADVDLLQEQSYTFESNTNDYASRFRLLYKAESLLPNGDVNESFAYFDGSVWVIDNEGSSSLVISDAMGRIVRSETLNGNATLNLSNLSGGLYVMQLVNETDTKTQKIVIQ